MGAKFVRDATPLLGLKNIGPTIAARLAAVGVRTVGDLRALRPAEAYRRLRAANPGKTIPVCYYLYSLQGALDGVSWEALPQSTKEWLLGEIGAKRATPASRCGRRYG